MERGVERMEMSDGGKKRGEDRGKLGGGKNIQLMRTSKIKSEEKQ